MRQMYWARFMRNGEDKGSDLSSDVAVWMEYVWFGMMIVASVHHEYAKKYLVCKRKTSVWTVM